MFRRRSIGPFWMVWDREKRGPAKIGYRPMVRLTKAEAEQAMSGLTVTSNRMKGSQHLGSRTWEVKYGGSVTYHARMKTMRNYWRESF